ncbi:hypothetical protein ACTI_34660 [Actinoplanes sp. OR16]|uniref:ElyC/SanA/YdcF family protein n=1 Tax=Actinoplanes sp. OR16 TaxID=946334 RepID=UPI000F71E3B4|nr:ElyC/SanA/YdcF family protein [Actinoplanes sp. OR16]BBH66781.1 hypothetical protein ACTI_34660 [Actinoplanes sp. OR16]
MEILAGTPGLAFSQVVHVLVPGHGRNADATGLTPGGEARCRVAAGLGLPGRIVCAGYKSPVDRKGAAWTTADAPGEVFQGVPEADLMRSWLVSAGVAPTSISVERHSIDTVTNLLRAEHGSHFGDDRPVAIVTQRGHLQRILSIVAPRTLRRPYLGVVVPGDIVESPLAAPVSRLISARLPSNPQAAITTAERRSTLLWRTAERLGKRTYH